MAVRPSVFFFFAYGRQSWSERYWYVGDPGLEAVAAAGNGLLLARCNMFAAGVENVGNYASYDDEFRDVFLIANKFPNPATGFWNAGLQDRIEQPNVSLMIRCQAAPARSGKVIYISGMPDNAVALPPLRPPSNQTLAFKDAINDFMALLVQQPWGWKGVSYDPAISPVTNVVSLTPAAGGWTAVVGTTVGFPAGKRAKLSNGAFVGPVPPRGNRRYLITGVNPLTNTLTLSWEGLDLSALTYGGGGSLQVQNPFIFKITKAYQEKITTRKRGVGANQPRGRVRRRPSR